MPRSDRLFRLMQLLRTLPAPVSAARLAEETGRSERTIYRDIATLRGAGARIEGEAGYGYTLTEDWALPPQSFTRLELEAVLLGLGEVRQSGDAALAAAAAEAAAKLVARLPERQQREAMTAALRVYRNARPGLPEGHLDLLRRACWDEEAVDLTYADETGRETARRVLPLQIVYLDRVLILLAWCCLREDFRRFRPDRILRADLTGESFRPRRVPLLREFVGQITAARRTDSERTGG